jgi:uncharacterized protein with NRDE domain
MGYSSALTRLARRIGLQKAPELGTWLGVNRAGRFAAITNVREPGKENPNARSRGLLVSAFLEGHCSAEDYAAELMNSATTYNGFNLLFGDARAVYYFSNRAPGPALKLQPGTYALSNAQLDTPWHKVRKIQWEFSRLRQPVAVEDLFRIFADDTAAPDDEVQQTGLPFAIEKGLSSVFIKLPGYGTRVTSVVTFKAGGAVVFIERTYKRGKFNFEREFRFTTGEYP